MPRVRAKVQCFAGGARRRQGEVFDVALREGDEIPEFLVQVQEAATTPDVLAPQIPGQAPRSGDTPDDVAMTEGPEGTVPPSGDEEAYLQ